ncbi:hypothetical protein Tco_0450502 [Tanacetum coccineum]
MADHLRPMEELLQIPIIGIEDAIVVPAVLADRFELKPELLDFIIPDDVVKLILFPFSLKGAAESWLENEPSNSITTWDDLVSNGVDNLMMRNTQETLTTIENKARVRTCRNKPQVSSSGGTSTQIDAITALTKQVEALEYHFASMRETYDHNQEVVIQLMQNQMGQMHESFQERPLGVLPSNTVKDPFAKLNVITSMDGLTLDGSFIPNF